MRKKKSEYHELSNQDRLWYEANNSDQNGVPDLMLNISYIFIIYLFILFLVVMNVKNDEN